MKKLYSTYLETEYNLMKNLNVEQISKAVELIADAYNHKKQIFVMGNGGSAATANHFVADLGKNAVLDLSKRRFKILSLSESCEKITAFGNDIRFEEVFSQQLINLINDDDLLIAISASGSSPNLICACEYAKTRSAKIISLSGFDGGKIAEYSDVLISTPSTCYEQIEDMHSIIAHLFITYFKENQDVLNS